ncbi:NAD-dependent epimerase/dehydratase family protein [Yinghuangia seranimata]|uniref:NAD-dependent epimerase/dehydratase family protein n=1 Tax=Yinghuangia seranimata TaxID=408067 RepID=UPI00248C3DEA|nr:NAD(P)-dependent oxidoreductase [Yinghuangia seranimata]MDI2131850.1 NAD(P)-dependent oxidoreductase [Yinghuangia seranimata]
MRVFLAGATGAIGRLMVPMLITEGHEVVGTSRTDRGVEAVRALGGHGVRVDAFDADALRKAVAEAAPDAVVHQLTALNNSTPAEHGRLRREGTRNLVDAALLAGVQRIVAQSIAFTYAPGDTPADERTPLDLDAAPPREGTVASAHALESISAELPQHVVLRYGTLYGPGTWFAPDGGAARLLRGEALDDTERTFLTGLAADDGVHSFVHVEDAARAAVAALAWPSGIVNIVDDEPAAARDWLPVFADAVGGTAPEPAPPGTRIGWQRGADNTYARRGLGWQPLFPTWRTGFSAAH